MQPRHLRSRFEPDRDVIKCITAGHTGINQAAVYQQAFDLAGEIGALGEQLRPAIKLARLMFGDGEAQAAQDLLQGVYQRFTEGFDTYSLRSAREILATISTALKVKEY